MPVVPGSRGGTADDPGLDAEARRLGFPLLVKASAGGGGKGMSRVDRAEDLPEALAEARRVASAAFGDGTVYLERLLEGCRHVEFQVFGDSRGNVVHLFERDCSVQRRHQKIVEETPSPALTPALRGAMGQAAVAAAKAVGYVGAGTVEFLLAPDGAFFFLEMNTRLQVEHGITEETLGCDLVRAQLDVASGASLPESWVRGAIVPSGHAIELRLYAEDPVHFLPRSGRLLAYREPAGPGIRIDAGVAEGSRVGVEYDPLLAKLIVHAETREAAIARARRAVAEWVVLGVETNRPTLGAVLESPEFRSGRYATDLVASPGAPAPIAMLRCRMPRGSRPRSPHPLRASVPAAAGAPASGADPWDGAAGWRMGA